MLLRAEFLKYDNHTIYSDWRLTSDYTPLTVNISIFKEYIQTRKQILVKNSKEEEYFLNKLIKAINEINTENIQSKEVLKFVVQLFTIHTDRIWYKHSKIVNITKNSKKW